MKTRSIPFAILIVLSTVASTSADIKVKTRTTTAGAPMEGTTYIKGPRQRTSQSMGGTTISDSIYQCDLKRVIQINDLTKRYLLQQIETETSTESGDKPQSEKAQTPESKPGVTRKGGVITYTSTAVDTGERKDFFGFQARRIKTSMTAESSPDACYPVKMRTETDGWYIDLEYGLYCSSDRPYVPPMYSGARPECRDQIRYKTSGSVKMGYPVQLTTIMYGADGKATTTTTEVIELSKATLDASLFDIPAGYAEAGDFQELMGIPSAGSIAGGSQPVPQQGQAAVTSVATKRPGTLRVGVVRVNNKAGGGVSTDSVRSTIVTNIIGSNIDAVPLDSNSRPAVEEEARQKGCDYILFTDITELKKAGSKVGGLLGRAAGVGIGKETHESRLDFKLFPVDSLQPQLTSSSKAKEEGAEEVSLSAAAVREANAVVAELKKRK